MLSSTVRRADGERRVNGAESGPERGKGQEGEGHEGNRSDCP
ncbi:hypothetical protein ABT263_20935 [Kitasatospora sp. NPDC001603]